MVKRLTTRPPGRRSSAITLPLVKSDIAKADLERHLLSLSEKAETASSLLSSLPSDSDDFVSANSSILKFVVSFETAAKNLASKIPSDDGSNMQMLTLAVETLLGGLVSDSLLTFTDHRAAGEIRTSSLSKRTADSTLLISAVMAIVSPLFDSFSVEKPSS